MKLSEIPTRNASPVMAFCYPPTEEIEITSTCIQSNLQPLVNLTAWRLSIYQVEDLMRLKQEERDGLKIIWKWGGDGSQQSQCKQKFENDAHANIYQSCLYF